MPPARDLLLWTIGLPVLRLLLEWVYGSIVNRVIAGSLAAVCVYVGARLAWNRWQIRRVVRRLRTLTVNDRAAVLERLDSVDASYFELRLAEHGQPEELGLVERFGFSPVDCREFAVLTWVTTGAAAVVLLAPVFTDWANQWRAVALVSGLALAAAAWVLLKTLERLARTFELSPFGLSEVLPDGTVRRVLWGYGLVLRNRPWLGRIELVIADTRDGIRIPYRIVGFDRLLEGMLEKGGFQRTS